MLRITEGARASGALTLRLEGRIVGDLVAVLDGECRRLLEDGERVQLDLADVTSIDAEGIRLLRALRVLGVPLTNGPAFLAGRLDPED